MNIKTKEKIRLLIKRIDIVEKRIRKILKDCAMSNDETLGFWSQKQKELRWEYDILKTIFLHITTYTISNEYWEKLNKEISKIKNYKSIDIKKIDYKQYKNQLVHKRTIKNLINKSYNNFVNSINVGYKNKMNMLNKIQQAIIKVNRIEKAGLNDSE